MAGGHHAQERLRTNRRRPLVRGPYPQAALRGVEEDRLRGAVQGMGNNIDTLR